MVLLNSLILIFALTLTGPQSASKPLVILCVVAVLLVTLAVTIITAFQFVLIMNKNKKPLSGTYVLNLGSSKFLISWH